MNLVKIEPSFFKPYFNEDRIDENLFYLQQLPGDLVDCRLIIKDNCTLSGLSYFFSAFNYLGYFEENNWSELFKSFEGKTFNKVDMEEIHFRLPFNVALTAERIALNLLQHSSAVSTETKKYTTLAKEKNIKILDTRKTTPGLRTLEKYAVRIGGGVNHRFSQTDLWMIKDNHKAFFGGVKGAVEFFKNSGSFYRPIELEVHNLDELNEGREFGIKHFMLDNFSPKLVSEAIESKLEGETFEVSGGITLESLSNYLIDGVDAISVGKITYGATPVDISLKYSR
jgi:nicotinate-nucleotide pyrophosphorylase (carboxylating)